MDPRDSGSWWQGGPGRVGPGCQWWIDFSATDLKVTATVTVQTRGNTLARYLAVVPAPKLKEPAPQRSPIVAPFAAGRNSTTESRCPLGFFCVVLFRAYLPIQLP